MIFLCFYKGHIFCDFLLASINAEALPNSGLLWNPLFGPNSLLSVDFIEMGGKKENGRVTSSERVHKQFKVYEYTSMIFLPFYKGKQLLWLPVCYSGQCSPFKKGSTLKGKNLLLMEQSLFYKSWFLMRWEAKMKIKELLSLKVYPFPIMSACTIVFET